MKLWSCVLALYICFLTEIPFHEVHKQAVIFAANPGVLDDDTSCSAEAVGECLAELFHCWSGRGVWLSKKRAQVEGRKGTAIAQAVPLGIVRQNEPAVKLGQSRARCFLKI